VKCCIYPTEALLIAIIRRLDLDADARLSKKEFFDGIMPIENYTRNSLHNFKKATKRPKSSSFARVTRHGMSIRPSTSTAAAPAKNPLGNLLHGQASKQERSYMRQQHVYQD
jgi:hypothetical protein